MIVRRLVAYSGDDDVSIAKIAWAGIGHARFRRGASPERVNRGASGCIACVGPDEPGVLIVADEGVVVALELCCQRVGAGAIRIRARRTGLDRRCEGLLFMDSAT